MCCLEAMYLDVEKVLPLMVSGREPDAQGRVAAGAARTTILPVISWP